LAALSVSAGLSPCGHPAAFPRAVGATALRAEEGMREGGKDAARSGAGSGVGQEDFFLKCWREFQGKWLGEERLAYF